MIYSEQIQNYKTDIKSYLQISDSWNHNLLELNQISISQMYMKEFCGDWSRFIFDLIIWLIKSKINLDQSPQKSFIYICEMLIWLSSKNFWFQLSESWR